MWRRASNCPRALNLGPGVLAAERVEHRGRPQGICMRTSATIELKDRKRCKVPERNSLLELVKDKWGTRRKG